MPMRVTRGVSSTLCPYCDEWFETGTRHECPAHDVDTPEKAAAFLLGRVDALRSERDVKGFVEAIATLLKARESA